jgi:uncharacterized membrane protein YdjX (TVP38/TMEM64 family)
MSRKILVFLTLVLIVVYMNVMGDISPKSIFEFIRSQQIILDAYVLSHPALARLIFVIAYILFCISFLPGVFVLTLLAGNMFGLVEGIAIVAIASTSGATLSFLIARYFVSEKATRYLSRNLLYKQLRTQLGKPFILLVLRLLPIIPFNFLNLAMALTNISTSKFFIYSLLGMSPMIYLTVNLGTHISQVSSISGLVSPEIQSAFLYLSVFILIVGFLAQHYKAKHKN